MKLITSWDDGHKLDLRLADMLKGFNLPGIFYIPTRSELSGSDIMDLHDARFEIGAHTRTHPQDMKYLDEEDIRNEILSNKLFLESIIYDDVKTFAYPRGRYSDKIIAALKEFSFEWARTTEILWIGEERDPFLTPTTIHGGYQRKEYNDKDWLEVAKRYFERVAESPMDGATFHLWGHSWEIEKFNQWDKLEDLFEHLSEHKKLWKQY